MLHQSWTVTTGGVLLLDAAGASGVWWQDHGQVQAYRQGQGDPGISHCDEQATRANAKRAGLEP